MLHLKQILSCFCVVLVWHAVTLGQVRVILDADIDSDVDDVEALAMLHTLADEKKIDLLGVIVTSNDPYAPTCVDAINTYFGRPGLPIGFLKNQQALTNHSRYTRQLSEAFPHRLTSHQDAQEAAGLYRKLLSNSPDSSVVIITIGHLTSLQRLLQSGADHHSPLSGKALTDQKVTKWICMGGTFPAGKEANFYRPDPASTLYCLQEWKKQVVFCGWEVGKEVITGGEYLKNRLTPKSPVYRAYELYNQFAGRPSWDQIAVFLLTDESNKYFATVNKGYCQVQSDGSNQWVHEKDSNHEYVIFKTGAQPEAIARYIDAMIKK